MNRLMACVVLLLSGVLSSSLKPSFRPFSGFVLASTTETANPLERLLFEDLKENMRAWGARFSPAVQDRIIINLTSFDNGSVRAKAQIGRYKICEAWSEIDQEDLNHHVRDTGTRNQRIARHLADRLVSGLHLKVTNQKLPGVTDNRF